MRDLPWFAMGKAQLAEFLERPEPDDLVRARAVAAGGQARLSGFGRRAALPDAIVKRIEAPGLPASRHARGWRRTAARSSSRTRTWRASRSAHSRSISPARVAAATDLNRILPASRGRWRRSLAGAPAARVVGDAARDAGLPRAPDVRRAAVKQQGLYVVAASGGESFGAAGFPLVATNFLLSDLVLMIPQSAAREAGGSSSLELRALSGATGTPLEGVDVTLLRGNWNPVRVDRLAAARSDAGGYAALRIRRGPAVEQPVSLRPQGRRPRARHEPAATAQARILRTRDDRVARVHGPEHLPPAADDPLEGPGLSRQSRPSAASRRSRSRR